MHVSTAYSNCDLEHVPEKIVPSTVRPEDIDALSDEDAVKLTPALIGDKPNTYTFTKSLAENLLRKEGAQLPITIVRPSISTCVCHDEVKVCNERVLTGIN